MRPIGTRIALRLPRLLTERLGGPRSADGVGTPSSALADSSPFLAARTEFTNAFGDLARGKRNWQLMAFGLGGLLALVTVAYVHLAASARVVPYIVQVDRLGQVMAVGRADAVPRPDDRLIASELAQFVRAIRTVLPAPAAAAQAELLQRGYAFAAPGARPRSSTPTSLQPAHDPRVLGIHLTREVDVASVLRIPNSDVWQLRWTETGALDRAWRAGAARSRGGELIAP